MSVVERMLDRERSAARVEPQGESMSDMLESGRATADIGMIDSMLLSNEASPVNLDVERGAARGYNFIGKSAPMLTNQFRSAKQLLLEHVAGQRKAGASPIIAVTSAVAGEGKSFTSVNLSLSLAMERGVAVTLIDFDTIRPASTLLFDAEKLEGLQDYLNGTSKLESVLRGTNHGNLSFISAGLEVENSIELLTSPALDEMLALFRSQGPQHLFVFDCPPLLASEATRYLARRADFTVLVVRAEKTSQHWTAEAVEKLGADSKFGLLLNGRVGTPVDQYYGYYKLEK